MEFLTPRTRVRRAMHRVKKFEWEGDYRPAARDAVKQLLEVGMILWADKHLADLASRGEAN